MKPTSKRTLSLKQSGIRSASQRCNEIGGINLGQGICDLPVPQPILERAFEVMKTGNNTYTSCSGILRLREKLSQKINQFNQIPVSIENILVGHGSTGAFVCATMTLFDPGDEVILFEPFYGYHKNVLAQLGVVVRGCPVNTKTFEIDWNQLESLINSKTKGLLICTPNNPLGKVYQKEELLRLGRLAQKNNLWVLTDEIYEYIVYPGHEHISLASLENFKDFTITISGFSKTYNMTGWRIGYASGPAHVIEKMSLVQDLLYICPTTPLQAAGVAALELPQSYYTDMAANYLKKRDFMVRNLRDLGFDLAEPQGAYYIMADFSKMGFKDDAAAAKTLLEKAHVATVTGGSFYQNQVDGQNVVRFCYALSQDVLEKAVEQMRKAF